jgi:Calcium-binding EGF domain
LDKYPGYVKGVCSKQCQTLCLDFPSFTAAANQCRCNGPAFKCGPNAKVASTKQGCICKTGYKGNNPVKGCTDLDECALSKLVCATDQECRNTVGSFSCNAPINPCDVSIVAYINCITLGNRLLTMTGTTAEDKALQWLVVNDTLALMPNSTETKARLRQRFALLSLGFQSTTNNRFVFQDVPWNIGASSECDWHTHRDWGFKCQDGQVTNVLAASVKGTLPLDLSWLTALDSLRLVNGELAGTLPTQLGWLTGLTTVALSNNRLSGTIPSSIGAWTDVTSLSLWGNKLTGTVPSSVSRWTAVYLAYLFSNDLHGTMPTFGGDFCPQKGDGVFLSADCNNNTGQAKISCECCNDCY